MIRAQILKEFREYARWTLIGALVLSALSAYLLYADSASGRSVVGMPYLGVLMFDFAIAGMACGIMVIMPDQRPGYWGFAAHRPLERWKLFTAKLIAAMVLYTAATTTAVLTAVACANLPRLVHAPFDASMIIPTLYIQLAGIPWVACGMLVVSRQARWVGSRLFPIAIVAVAACATYLLAPRFSLAIWPPVVMAALLTVLAVTYFAHNGLFTTQPLWSRLLAGFVVAIGTTTAFTVAVILLVQGLGLIIGRDTLRYSYSSYHVDRTGHPYREFMNPRGQTEYQDEYGKTLPPERAAPGGLAGTWAQDVNYFDREDPTLPWQARSTFNSFLNADRYVQPFGTTFNGERWVFVTSRRTLEGFTLDGEYVGCLGPDGSFGPELKPFPPGASVDSNYLYGTEPLIHTGDTIYAFELQSRSVRVVFHTDSAEPILSARFMMAEASRRFGWSLSVGRGDTIGPTARLIAVVTRRHLYIRPTEPEQVERMTKTPPPNFTVPLSDLGWAANMTVSLLADDAIAVISDRSPIDRAPVLIIMKDGQVKTQDLPKIIAPPEPPQPWTDHLDGLVIPPALPIATWWRWRMDTPFDAWLLIVPAAALVAVLITLWMARRYALRRGQTITWAVLAALFGLHIPLTLFCLRERPARISCPACGKARRVNGDRCEHCGAVWPAPGNPATDVFETQDRAAA
ncbi:MAG: hypothetical protein JWM57_1859 [Phycisphaerales bacterium]|nr:hypothetical protein [Phycisphaerales bacterium]